LKIKLNPDEEETDENGKHKEVDLQKNKQDNKSMSKKKDK